MGWFSKTVTVAVLCGVAYGGYLLLTHPQTPLPPAWNPTKPLNITDTVTPITSWKMTRAQADRDSCYAALNTYAKFTPMEDFERSDQCHVRNRVKLQSLAGIVILPIETRCETALVTAMWLEHGVKPAAREVLGQSVKAVRTQGSYNCRNIAGSSRRSTHSTAKSIDIAGFTLANGQKIELSQSWDDAGATSTFLKEIRDTSCDWYATTLGPDYNRAHADHFHLQIEGWGLCR